MKDTTKLIFNSMFLSLFFSCIISKMDAQSIGVSGGIGQMSFFDFYDDNDHFYANYTSGSHQYFKVSFNEYLPEASFINLYVNIERSTGTIFTAPQNFMFCGVGPTPVYEPSMNDELTLYRMGIGFVPLDIKIVKGLRVRVGTEFSRIFRKAITGTYLPVLNENPRNVNLDDALEQVRDIAVGAIFELQFGQFSLGDHLSISPTYNANIGIFEEIETGYKTRSVRQALGLAFIWDIKPKVALKTEL